MNVLIWHVHGSWTTAFVQGDHRYLIPAVPGLGPDGRGRARTWDWPDSAVDVTPGDLAAMPIDLVVLQRPRDVELFEEWAGGRRLGIDVAAVWLEHDAPQGRINDMVHPAAERTDISRVVHVTHTNDLFWDCGSLPTVVIEHGVIDPGHRWSGDIDAMAVVVNEPLRRGRVTGTDLLERFGAVGPVDLFGMGVDAMTAAGCSWLRTHEDLPQATMHTELARRRLYVHPFRWTSLGLSLIEAMLLGMPVVALATTETPDAVPAGCGIVSNDVASLARTAARLLVDRDECAVMGAAARDHALARFGLPRFLDDWDRLMKEVVG